METLPDGLLTLILIMDIAVYFFATISSQALFSSESTKLKLKCEQDGGKKAYELCENSERYNFSLKILKLLLEAILLFTVGKNCCGTRRSIPYLFSADIWIQNRCATEAPWKTFA